MNELKNSQNDLVKKFIITILVFNLFTACNNPKSIRHLFRAASKTVEKNQTDQLENIMGDIGIGPKLNSYNLVKDSAGTAYYKADYIIQDTLQYLKLTSIKVPYDLKFNKKSHSKWVADISFFQDSVSNTPYDNQTISFRDSSYNGFEFACKVLR